MNHNRKIKLLFILGILLILGAPYFPSCIFQVIYLYDYHFQEIRFENIISSIRTGGIILSAWGIAKITTKKGMMVLS